jgi:hypothetical protein
MTYLFVILSLTILWLTVLSITVFKVLNHYRKLIRGVSSESLQGVWEKYLEKEKQNEEQINNLLRDVLAIQEKSRSYIQRLGVTRFNPFNDAGGNQSFAATLLDENGTGMLLSSLHGRDLTRVYAKPVKGYKPDGFDFSQEEQDAVSIAKAAKH